MSNTIPASHIADAHKLNADGYVELFELTPSGGGSGVVRFKDSNNVTWRTNLYTGVPLSMSGERKSAEAGLAMPRLTIGQADVDLSQFKGLVYDGYLDGAVIVRREILLTNLLANSLITKDTTFRVKRVETYSRSQINMQLATLSDSLGFSLPYRSYAPPDYPSVQM